MCKLQSKTQRTRGVANYDQPKMAPPGHVRMQRPAASYQEAETVRSEHDCEQPGTEHPRALSGPWQEGSPREAGLRAGARHRATHQPREIQGAFVAH